ncbi:hypothetical protein GCM10009780_62890 [Actinomadura alba]
MITGGDGLDHVARARMATSGRRHTVDLVRSEMAWPVRAHIEFTIRNEKAL